MTFCELTDFKHFEGFWKSHDANQMSKFTRVEKIFFSITGGGLTIMENSIKRMFFLLKASLNSNHLFTLWCILKYSAQKCPNLSEVVCIWSVHLYYFNYLDVGLRTEKWLMRYYFKRLLACLLKSSPVSLFLFNLSVAIVKGKPLGSKTSG